VENFKVGIYEEVGAMIVVSANSPKEAEEKARKILEQEGVPLDAKVVHRDFNTTGLMQ